MSQCQVLGEKPVKTWKDYRNGCLATYAGGHHGDGHLDAFRHGMETVFNLLEEEFPPAELCKVAPDLLRGCRAASAYLCDPPSEFPANRDAATTIIRDAIDKAQAL